MHFDNFNLHCVISIHALLAESDPSGCRRPCERPTFLSTLSLRRATSSSRNANHPLIFLSTLSLRRATIRIHRLCVPSQFLSTLSLRRATLNPAQLFQGSLDFYPRSPCGERLQCRCSRPIAAAFLSTLSLRRATVNTYHRIFGEGISIHALLAESDSIIDIVNNVINHFYPRSPCGERQALGLLGWLRVLISIHALLAESDLILRMAHLTEHLFLSTLSLRRATQ